MDLDSFKQAWSEHDRRLDAALHLDRARLQRAALDGARTVLQRHRAVLVYELVGWALPLLPLGAFLAAHRAEPRFLLPALLLHLGCVAGVIATVRQLVGTRRLAPDAPVAHVQHQLAALRVLRARTHFVLLLLSPLAWALGTLVLVRAWAGVDLYRLLGSGVVLAHVVLCAAFVPAVLVLLRLLPERLKRAYLAQGLARALSGSRLAAAQDSLARASELEREAPGAR